VVHVTALPLKASLIAHEALVSDAVRVMVLDVAHGIIQSGRYSPVEEKLVETCLPSTKSEKAAEVGLAEYTPIVHIIDVAVVVTTGVFVGTIAATCDRPPIDADADSYPVRVVVTVTVVFASRPRLVTVTRPVELIVAVPGVAETLYVYAESKLATLTVKR